MRAAAVALVVGALALAGCSSPPATFKAHGSKPLIFAGYDYQGASGVQGQGSADIDVDPAKDTGTAVFTFGAANGTATVQFTQFREAPGKAFQQGGVRDDFPEHGNTGNGDALLPTLHALSAGWGVGTLALNGQPQVDPATGQAEFALHYMVTDTGPRDPGTHKVTKADGSTPYDPASPTDAKLTTTKEILLNVQSAGTPAPVNTTVNVAGTLQPPQDDQTKDAFTVNTTGASANLTYTVSGAAPGIPPVGQVTFALKLGPATVDTCAIQPPPDPTQASAGCQHNLKGLAAGKYVVEVIGQGAAGAYTVAGSVEEQVQPVFVHVVYTDVTVG